MTVMSKTDTGRFFEDFELGEQLVHATPRTVTTGDASLYMALHGARFALTSSQEAARAVGLGGAVIDEMLAFHIVFGKTVPDVSINAVANLGYAEGRFRKPVRPGDTVRAVSDVIGLKETSAGDTGIVYVRTEGFNQDDAFVMDYVRWVLVRKRDKASPPAQTTVPQLKPALTPVDLIVPNRLNLAAYDPAWTGSKALFEDYVVGECIDHVDGMTVEEAEHQSATRLYQNTAKVHFNQFQESKGRFGRRLIYGGYVISMARALSFNGLANAVLIAGINGGRHVAPLFAGDTVFAWTQVLDSASLPGPGKVGALRLRTRATKNHPCTDFPADGPDGKPHPAVILDFDYWVLMPRRA